MPVVQTGVKTVIENIQVPVQKTCYRTVPYQVTVPVQKTVIQAQQYTQMVPVKQCSYREEQYTVQRPVYNTVMQEVQLQVTVPVRRTVIKQVPVTVTEAAFANTRHANLSVHGLPPGSSDDLDADGERRRSIGQSPKPRRSSTRKTVCVPVTVASAPARVCETVCEQVYDVPARSSAPTVSGFSAPAAMKTA